MKIIVFTISREEKGNHRVVSIVYKGDCVTCYEKGQSSRPDKDGRISTISVRKPKTKSKYVGETSRSNLVKGGHHLKAIECPQLHQENAFARHSSINYHDGEVPKDVFFVIGCHHRLLDRQLWEDIHIMKAEMECDILMNSKNDHFSPAVGKLDIQKRFSDLKYDRLKEDKNSKEERRKF
jgi:hypothetical protein